MGVLEIETTDAPALLVKNFGPEGEQTILETGDCLTFSADRPHVYAAIDGPARRAARGEIDAVIRIPGPRQRPRQGKADAPRRPGDHRDASSHGPRLQAAAAIAANWRAEFRQVNPMA